MPLPIPLRAVFAKEVISNRATDRRPSTGREGEVIDALPFHDPHHFDRVARTNVSPAEAPRTGLVAVNLAGLGIDVRRLHLISPRGA